MESGNGAASSKGVLVPVSASSDAFQNSILGPLKSAYLYEESKQSFRYKSAFLVKNPALEKKYNAFRAKRRRAGYSKEDLKESYGFLLFDDVNKAHALCETGVLTGNSTCTTLGDPSKGVYISMYSDCLDLNRWYHGKSGYIAIIKLTKGKVNKVLENYTQNFTAPTKGFDCHVSEQLPSVSAKTSSFLAFERTQYYIYELLKAGNSETAQSPSAACPFAIASFSYTDTKATLEEPEEKSEENKLVHHYFPWRGQLQIGPHLYDVGLRSTAGALIPAELPPVVKVERATSLIELRKLLPRTVFETCFTGEVFLDGLYCSLCELVSSETEQSSSLSQLLSEIKEKDVALTVPLNDGGFLILLHSSHFFTFDDTGSSAAEVLQGVFVFPDSRVVQRDTKFGQKKPAVSSDILRVLPALSYAEGEVEKTPTDLSEELYEVFAQHIQSYAAMINPGLALSPSRDISIFPDQYDVPDAHKHLYSSPEWTNRAWQNLKSYVDKPLSFQLPVSKASEILAAGQEERIEDLHDDVYFCLSSPEEAPASHGSMASEDQLTGEKSVVNVETSVDSHMTSSEDQVDSTAAPENECLQPGDVTKDTEKSDLTVLIKTDTGTKNLLTPSTSDDLPAELIVSITSAERTVTDSVISTESATNQNDFPLSGYSTTKAQMEEGNSLNDENVEPKEIFDPPQLTNHQIKHKKLHRSNVKNQEEESSGLPELSKPSKVDWRKARKRKRIFGTLSAKNRKLRSAAILLAAAAAKEKNSNPGRKSLKSPIVMEFEALPLRKKTERWDLKPVTSECGRILVPHGSVDMAGQIKALKDKLQSAKDEPCHEKMVVDDSLHAHDTNEMEQESSTASETIVAERKATAPKDSGNHHQDISNIHLGNSISRQPDGDSGSSTLQPESGELSSKDDGGNTSSVKTVQEKHTDTPSTGKSSTRGEFLLKKLKSVLLRGKRKMGLIGPEETTADVAQDTQPCPKKGKVDSQSGMLTSNDTSTCVQNTNVDGKDVSKILSVDPLFAFALGLTPKEASETTQKAEDQDTQQKKDSSETQEQTILQKQPQIIQQPLSIFPRRGRIKTLKKHQGISEENVKKKCTPFHVSPLYGSTRLLHHHQTMYGDGIKILHHTIDQEDKSEQVSPEYLKKHMVRRRKFRQSRTFDSKDGSVQVTRQWKENYDFNQDSKFTNDSKERAIIRAIHGPWDLNIEDTNEEVRLIVHMWIGLFYSRSTARFFHLDSNLCSEESDSLEKSTGMVSAPPQSDLTAGSLAPCLNATDTSDTSISKALDLSKKDNSVLDQGPVILDLSIRNSVVENVTPEPILNKKETSVSVEKQASATLSTPKSPLAIKKCYIKSIHCPEVISGLIEARRNYKSKRTVIPLQKAVCLKQTDVPSFKGGGTVFSGQEEMETASPQLQNHQTASGTGHVSHGCNNAKRKMKDGIESTSAIEISLVQKQGRDSSKSEMDKGADFIREEGDVVLRVEHDEHESKDGENCQVKEKPCQEGSQGDDSTKEELGIVSNGNLLENKKRLCMEEPKTVSPGKAESGNENVDCCAVREDKVTEDDQSRKVDGLVEKDTHIPDVEAANDLNNQPLPMMCDGPDSEKEHCQTPVDEQQLQVDNKEDAYNNGELRKLCANGRGRTNEPTISVKVPPAPSETDPVDSEPVAVEENSENGPRLTDLSDQALPMRSDGPDSLKDCITECNDQTPLDEQRSEVNSEEEACHDAISEKAPSLASEMERIGCEIAVRKNSENGDCLADLSHQSGQMICEGPDSGKDSITDSSHQAPLDQQPPQAENEGAACHDLESSKLSAKGSAMSDKTPHVPSEMERIGCEIAVRKNSENGDCLADLSHQSIQMICEGPDSVKDSITDSSHQAPLDQQPPEGGNEGVACHDLESSKLSAKGSAMSDKTPHVPSEMEPIDLEIAVRKNSENGDCLADMSHQSIPMICEGPDSVKDSITDSSHQAPLDQQPPQAGNEGVACHDLESSKLSAKGSAVSGKTPHVPSEMEPIDREIAVRKNSENGVCLADLSHQSIPMICEGPDSVKVSITDSSHQAPLDQQPPQADNEGAACHDFELSKLSANGSAMTAEDAMPDKTPHTPSEMEATDCKIAVEENSENSSCLADLNVQQIPMICDNPDSVKMDNVAECSRQVPLDEQSPQADNKEDAGHDRNWHKLCANINSSTDEHAMPGKCPHAPAEVELADSSPVAKENSENYTCLPEKANLQRSVPSMLDDNTCSLGGASTDRSNAQTNTSAETGSQNNVMATLTVGHNDHKDHDTKLNERKENAGRTTQNELFYNQSDSPQCGILTSCKMEEALPHETHPESDETNRRLEKINGRVVIPFIGVDISGEDVVQSDDSYSEDSVEVQKETSGITKSSYPETVLPTEVCSTTQMHIRKEELLAHKVSHQSVANQTQVSVSECDERCPTPTMDEEPYQYETCIDPSSSSSSTSSGSFALSSCETWKNRTQQHFSRSSTFVEMPLEQKHKSAVDSDPNPQHGLRPDLELRTLRVLQSINKFLSETSHSDKSSQIKTSDMKHPVDQTDRLQETSVGNDYFHSQRSFTPTEFLQAFKPDIEERHKTSRTNTSNEPRSHSQRPVMAVRPSKSDEIQAPAVTYTTMSSMLLEKKTESLKRNSVGLNEKQEASDFSYESSFSNVRDSKCTLDEAKFAFQDPLYQHHGRDSLKVSSTASSLSVQSFKSAKNSSKLVDGHQSFSRNSLVEREGKRAENSIETDWRHCSDASASFSGYRDDGIADSLYLGPQSSLTCTVFNTSKTKPVSFLEQLSQRCLQDDLTLASMEQECLIFSEQMKQLLKRTTRGPVSHLDAHEKLNVSRSSPVTVHFSNLEDEEDDLVDHLDTHSLEGQKIMVDMSDRTAQSDIRVEENTQRRGNPMEHAGVSSITAESARLYKAIMNDVCAARNVPFRFLHLGNDRGHPKTEESNHFDFCDQMKREMDESFRSSLNSVVKKSCKTKYRFFILVTSDDAFFEETKAQLEAEGHTAVQPSDFFLDEDGSSSLLIILRNEDIAEHICEVPHLLELKKSPRVQFAGIDEPDDVVNLTHQELFMRGGFVMFDRATLESLSLCNMKKMSEILEELSRTGKWKWMLHYRDSRRMKENARLSAEAKGKTHFLNWCQEAGILEVLPYHECDLMSRDQPDYLTCLVRLQVQNISSRYPVFITDTTSDSAFGTNGILTMTSSSFLTCSPSETFAV